MARSFDPPNFSEWDFDHTLRLLTDTSSFSQTHFPDGGQPVPVQLPDAVDSQPQQWRQVGIPENTIWTIT